MKNRVLAIIPAAGIGERFKSNIPKQYEYLDGCSVIEKTLQPFIESELISKIIIPVSKSDSFIEKQSFFDNEKVVVIEGGKTRAFSVLNALNEIDDSNFDYVITHDAARPNISSEDISTIYNEIISSNADCSFFYKPIVDSIKQAQSNTTLNKQDYYLVQTPQISKTTKLKLSLTSLISKNIDVPDESFVMEHENYLVSKIEGKASNIKITHSHDLDLVKKFNARVGTGFDLHTYRAGKGFTIGGYFLECDYEIEAHSDGDVLLHSIADSILGAAALGDIGIFFSDKDPSNKGLDSKKIIDFCLEKINKMNLEIHNIDATIICESPKISPHREKIIESLSKILKISKSNIGLKATTSEKLGIIGEHKAIAVQSLVNLKQII
jgi:2-C-methyl-D-erythritol 4-phosphate cytidylyltransferase/2-C-methyl-D-erythritol 2,4-cyclodiphosphate synthase